MLDRIRDHGLVAVIRAGSAEAAHRCSDALIAGSVRGIEIIYTTPDAAVAIAALAAEFGPAIALGAGTLTTPDQVADAGAGAEITRRAQRHTAVEHARG